MYILSGAVIQPSETTAFFFGIPIAISFPPKIIFPEWWGNTSSKSFLSDSVSVVFVASHTIIKSCCFCTIGRMLTSPLSCEEIASKIIPKNNKLIIPSAEKINPLRTHPHSQNFFLSIHNNKTFHSNTIGAGVAIKDRMYCISILHPHCMNVRIIFQKYTVFFPDGV